MEGNWLTMSVLRIVKHCLDIHLGKKSLDEVHIGDDIEYVSFDIFDTLLVRCLPKTVDLFEFIEKKNDITGFRDKRIASEKKARLESETGEVTILDIYKQYDMMYGCNVEDYVKLEFEAEKKVCRANPRCISFFNNSLKNKKVILVSDMYFPSGMMSELLEKCKITGYEHAYISCDENASKRNGKLFKRVLSKTGIMPEKILHIGNDFLSDYICAKSAGVKVCKVKTIPYRPDRVKSERILEINVDDQFNGGIYSVVKNLVICNDGRADIDIAAIRPFIDNENIRFFHDHGCKVYYIGCDGNRVLKQLCVYRKQKKLIENKGYDCVHIHSGTATRLFVSGVSARVSGVKRIILHSHSTGVEGKNQVLHGLLHRLLRRSLKWIGTEYIACSENAAKWMFPNVSAGDITIVHNGIDINRFRFDKNKRIIVRKKLGIGDEILIGHVGRFDYSKNHEYIIRVFKGIHVINSHVRLLLVGDGERFDSVKRIVKENGLEDNVFFVGESKDVASWMQAMDVFILPSRFEGFPLVGVEAQAVGLPVLLSNQITKEIGIRNDVFFLSISDSSVGQWVKMTTGLVPCSDEDREKAWETINEKGLSIETMVDKIIELYQGVPC